MITIIIMIIVIFIIISSILYNYNDEVSTILNTVKLSHAEYSGLNYPGYEPIISIAQLCALFLVHCQGEPPHVNQSH